MSTGQLTGDVYDFWKNERIDYFPTYNYSSVREL